MNLLQMPVNAARRAICPEHEKQPRRPLPDILALEEFTASACTATVVDLLPSFIQHLLTFTIRLVIHGTPRA